MTNFVVLDAGPLGLATNPRPNRDFMSWLDDTASAAVIVVPEICDYEVRRELIRAKKDLGLAGLDRLVSSCFYVGLSTQTMRLAAALWAEARQRGRPTASPDSLDADVILAASARRLQGPHHTVIVATDNARHLGLFVHARPWSEIGLA